MVGRTTAHPVIVDDHRSGSGPFPVMTIVASTYCFERARFSRALGLDLTGSRTPCILMAFGAQDVEGAFASGRGEENAAKIHDTFIQTVRILV